MSELTRKPRTQELRVSEPVHEAYPEYFEDDYLLSTKSIPPRPGYVQRWVRTMLQGRDDYANVFKKQNKGWQPRLLSTVPEGQFVMKIDFQGIEVIGIHGMILMERPEALHERQKSAIRRQTNLQMEAVKNDMYKVHDPSSGLSRPEYHLTSSESIGRRPALDDD